jgi:hypothetical protein
MIHFLPAFNVKERKIDRWFRAVVLMVYFWLLSGKTVSVTCHASLAKPLFMRVSGLFMAKINHVTLP